MQTFKSYIQSPVFTQEKHQVCTDSFTGAHKHIHMNKLAEVLRKSENETRDVSKAMASKSGSRSSK